jgi:hypothetical protein
MVNTGFYDVATRKAGERRAEKLAEFERKKRRLEELQIDMSTPPKYGANGATQQDNKNAWIRVGNMNPLFCEPVSVNWDFSHSKKVEDEHSVLEKSELFQFGSCHQVCHYNIYWRTVF